MHRDLAHALAFLALLALFGLELWILADLEAWIRLLLQ